MLMDGGEDAKFLIQQAMQLLERATSIMSRPPPVDPAIISTAVDSDLSPRIRETLCRLLAGDGEKEIGRNLKISQHTVHVYIKAIYRHYHVNSKGELMARFIDESLRKGEKMEAEAYQPPSDGKLREGR